MTASPASLTQSCNVSIDLVHPADGRNEADAAEVWEALSLGTSQTVLPYEIASTSPGRSAKRSSSSSPTGDGGRTSIRTIPCARAGPRSRETVERDTLSRSATSCCDRSS